MLIPTNITQKGNQLLIRVYDKETGTRRNLLTKFKPTIFERAPYGTPMEMADALPLRGEGHPINGRFPLRKVEFDNIWDFKNHVYDNVGVPGYEMYGMPEVEGQAYGSLFPGKFSHDLSKIVTVNIDIEVMSSYIDESGAIVRGPFPEPVIEPEEYRKSSFDLQAYTDHVVNFYGWWREEFPNSRVPQLLDIDECGALDAAFPVTMIQCENMQTGKIKIWSLPRPKDKGTYHYDNNDEMVGGEARNLESFEEFDTEQDLLKSWVKWWSTLSPDGFTGWNTTGFDSGYIVSRVIKILGREWANSLSPCGVVRKHLHRPDKGLPFHTWEMKGVSDLDLQRLYKKHRLVERKSHSLDYISKVETDDRKIEYTGDLNTVWLNDYTTYCRYGLKDVLLVRGINNKLKFIDLAWALQARYKANASTAAFDTVAPWRYLLYGFNYTRGDVPLVPLIKPKAETVDFEGAFVHTPIVGAHKLILAEDLNSLYPHIEQQYNMGPETIVEDELRANIIFDLCEEIRGITPTWEQTAAHSALLNAIQDDREIIDELINWSLAGLPNRFKCLTDHNVSMAPNLQFFHNDVESCYSLITKEIYGTRKAFKREMLDHEKAAVKAKEAGNMELYALESTLESQRNTFQMGEKIILNSGYGAIGNTSFKEYFDPRVARAITAAGALINKFVTAYVNRNLGELKGTPNVRSVVYGDTDSIYVTLDGLQSHIGLSDSMTRDEKVDAVDKWEKQYLAPLISNISEEMCVLVNGREQRMFWAREVLCLDGGIFQAKKKYALLVDDNEGVRYDKQKIKVTGLDSKKSTTPDLVVPWLEEAYILTIQGKFEEMRKYVKQRREEHRNLPLDEIAAAKGVNDISKWIVDEDNLIFKSRVPYHVRASVLHNVLLKRHGVTHRPFIEEGSKIRILNIKAENEFDSTGKTKYIAFPDTGWPSEFDQYRKYIDYKLSFATVFEDPLQLLLNVVGESTVEVNTLW